MITSRQVAADPDCVYAASDAYKVVFVQSRVHISPTTSAPNCDLFFVCIDRDTVEVAEVNDDTVFSTAGATSVITAALHSYIQILTVQILDSLTNNIGWHMNKPDRKFDRQRDIPCRGRQDYVSRSPFCNCRETT